MIGSIITLAATIAGHKAYAIAIAYDEAEVGKQGVGGY